MVGHWLILNLADGSLKSFESEAEGLDQIKSSSNPGSLMELLLESSWLLDGRFYIFVASYFC